MLLVKLNLRVSLRLTGLFLLTSLLSGCGSNNSDPLLDSSAPPLETSNGVVNVATSSTPVPSPPPLATHNVVMRVTGVPDSEKSLTGSAPSRPWMVKLGSGVNSPKTPLPITQNLSATTGQDVGISVQNWDWDLGQITIEITVDGKNVYTKTDKGFPLLIASYRIPPAGATAACMDRTFSFSENRQGSCSDHGGVYTFYFADGSEDETEGER